MSKVKLQEKDIVKILKNKKGQALVEFVMLLPIVIMILFIIIDFAFVFYNKNHLEGVLNDVVLLVENKKSDDEIKDVINNDAISYNIKFSDNIATIELQEKIDFITPFSDYFFPEKYIISTKRVILYE